MTQKQMMDTTENRIAVDVREAARLTGLSRSQIYVLIGEGRLKKRKVGARTLILVQDLHALFT